MKYVIIVFLLLGGCVNKFKVAMNVANQACQDGVTYSKAVAFYMDNEEEDEARKGCKETYELKK